MAQVAFALLISSSPTAPPFSSSLSFFVKADLFLTHNTAKWIYLRSIYYESKTKFHSDEAEEKSIDLIMYTRRMCAKIKR